MTQSLPPMMPGYTPRGEFWAYNDAPPEALLAPARRASLFLFGLGGLGVAFALLVGVGTAGLNDAELAPLIEQMRQQQRDNPDFAKLVTPQFVRGLCVTLAAIFLVAGAASAGVGALARGGQRGWLVLALLLAGGAAAGLAFALVASLLANPVAAVIVFGLPLALAVSAARAVLVALRAVPTLEFDAARRRMTLHGHGAMPPPGVRP